MRKEVVWLNAGAKPVGTYSPATKLGNLLVVGGNGPIDPVTQEVLRGDFEEEVRLTLRNMIECVEAGGSKKENILKVSVYLLDIKNFDRFNKVYSEFFNDPATVPTRAVVGVAGLWNDISVETECLAAVE